MRTTLPMFVVLLGLAFGCGTSSERAQSSRGASPSQGQEVNSGQERLAAGTSAPPSGPPQPSPVTRGGDADFVVGTDACTSDADCRPAECCHAAACVGAERAPRCVEAVCTMDCRAGTIDCGGGCLCHEGRCAARLIRAADFGIAPPP